MVISLPVPAVLQKETTEKVIEVRLPVISEIVTNNKFLVAFKTVLQAPVK